VVVVIFIIKTDKLNAVSKTTLKCSTISEILIASSLIALVAIRKGTGSEKPLDLISGC